jgi:hypothetical protein
MNLVRTKQRVVDHGEVFTPPWMVEAMLDLVKDETTRIDSRFLESACGSGNFVAKILQRKLAAVELTYSHSEFERKHYALWALMCIYGIELLDDNIQECRKKLVDIFSQYLDLTATDNFYRAAQVVVDLNIVHGDALTMLSNNEISITFSEWGYLGKGKYQRRDFDLEVLTGTSAFKAKDSLFADLGQHEIFTPTKTYPPMTAQQLAQLQGYI